MKWFMIILLINIYFIGYCYTSRCRCRKNQFECVMGPCKCINDYRRCNGIRDCTDGTDERGCPNDFVNELSKCYERSPDQISKGPVFRCSDNSYCIPIKELCTDRNGRQGCDDASDLQFCNYENQCHGGVIRNGKCWCNSGYELIERYNGDAFLKDKCQNINECASGKTCSQICVDTLGSFKCSCIEGFTLKGNRCHHTDLYNSILITIGSQTISYIDISNSNLRIPTFSIRKLRSNIIVNTVLSVDTIICMTYHRDLQLMFWSLNEIRSVMSSQVDFHDLPVKNKDVKKLDTEGIMQPHGLAIDWVHDLLFITDKELSRIEVGNLTFGNRKVIVFEKINKPIWILVSPKLGQIFWLEEKPMRIKSCGLDGSNVKTLFNPYNITYQTKSITLDYNSDRIYWLNINTLSIHSIHTSGKFYEQYKFATGYLPYPLGQTIFEDYIYICERHKRAIVRVSKLGYQLFSNVEKTTDETMCQSLEAYNPSIQKIIETSCSINNGGCSHLCLLDSSLRAVCACPTGIALKNDKRTCMNSIEEFMLVTDKTHIRRATIDKLSGVSKIHVVLHEDANARIADIDWIASDPDVGEFGGDG